jgi:1-acyl-sn-glycerol-3-phosphate acyltransferase
VALRINVVGSENAPATGPVIITANHFSWFDAPLLTIFLPYRPSFLVANESQRFWFVRLYMHLFQGIPIWRGQVDRAAITWLCIVFVKAKPSASSPRAALTRVFGCYASSGEAVTSTYGHTSRSDGQLTHPEPGTAYLAVRSKATILPVGLIGTEQILSNMLPATAYQRHRADRRGLWPAPSRSLVG